MNIKIHKDYIPVGHPNRPGRKLKSAKIIAIHWTANLTRGADVLNHIKYVGREYKKNNGKNKEINGEGFRYGAGQFYVDSKMIGSPIPEDEVAYHVGSSRYTQTKFNLFGDENPNNYAIGIECCVNVDDDFNGMLNNLISLIYYLMEKYNLTVNDIYRHYDITGKYCPMFAISEEAARNYDLQYLPMEKIKEMVINESERFIDDSEKKSKKIQTRSHDNFLVESKIYNLKLNKYDYPIKKLEEIIGLKQDGVWDNILEKVYLQIQNRPTMDLYNRNSKLFPHVVKFIQYTVGCEEIDGWYGAKTKDKVRQYQIKNYLIIDGAVGPNTWSCILY